MNSKTRQLSSNFSKKETRTFDLYSEDSDGGIGASEPNTGEFANVVKNYKDALARNDELLEEIQTVKKSSILLDAEVKAAQKRQSSLEQDRKKLQQQIRNLEQQISDQQTMERKLRHQVGELEQQYIQESEQQTQKLKLLKQESQQILLHMYLHKEMFRVLKSVVVSQFTNVTVEDIDRITNSILNKYSKGFRDVEAQHHSVAIRDVRRTLQAFFMEAVASQNQDKKQEKRETRRLEQLTDELEQLRQRNRQLQTKLVEYQRQANENREQLERVEQIRKQRQGQLENLVGRHVNTERRQYEKNLKDLQYQNSQMKQQIKKLRKGNTQLVEEYQQTIAILRKQVQQSKTVSRIHRNNHRSAPRRQSYSDASSQDDDYDFGNRLKTYSISQQYNELLHEYQTTVQAFRKLAETTNQNSIKIDEIVNQLQSSY